MATVKELVEQIRPAQIGIEQDGEIFISYDALMSDYQDYEAIMDKDEFATDAGYDMVLAQKKHYIVGNIDGLFTDDKSLLFYRMLREEIKMAVSYLPEIQQYIINNRYGLNGCSIKTRKVISEELEITERTVYSQEQSALNRLRKFEKIKSLKQK